MVGESMISEEVRIARRHDGLTRQQPGVAMIGMKAIPLPRVVAQHHLRSQLSDDVSDLASRGQVAVEFPVDAPEEPHLTGVRAGEAPRCLTLLVLAAGRQCGHIDVGIPGPLRTVGAHQVVHDTAVGSPLGEHPACSELDVVGVCTDRQRRGGRCEVGGGRCGEGGGVQRAGLAGFVGSHGGSTFRMRGWARSRAVSRSSDSPRSRRTSTSTVAIASAWLQVTRERSAAVARAEWMGGRERHHVRAVVAAVGDQGDAALVGDVEQRGGKGEVGVGDENVVVALRDDVADAVVDGTVETQSGAPDHLGTHPLRPLGDRVVVASDERGDLGDDVEHTARHPLGEAGPVAVAEHAGQAALGRRESLDRDQDGETH